MSEKERLISIMEHERMSARQFADEVGIQPGTVSNIMNDRNKPSLEVMQKVLKRFPAISPDWLISDYGSMYRQKNDSQQPVLFPTENNSETGFGTENKTETQSSHVQYPSTAGKSQVITNSQSNYNLTKETPTTMPPNTIIPSPKQIRKVVIFFDDNTFEEFTS
ncbi:MAG: helix-turn-helix domain-containing protein [Paludibacter sp.]|nr:helix-turn-helix domain-containing protein [Bacteroidales bacterium]MCM1069903.1 helix-turn-helix domain-containing protein [Prevotella sp.]MCM1354584.1 helix-turn-helix domain-containing protein [Bacteroides sp.]MCM1443479.1 helix-turn-helix domain-containing protein [Muribaculum sp.]MCM1482563.1 helix-turn-helix domain-containing protein [Paludibacter sp.]